MSKKYSILSLKIFVFIFLFFGCKNNSKVEKNIENKLTGIWYSANASLKIESDNTFVYTRFTCITHLTSYGKWTVKNDTLILNNAEPKGCYFYERWIINPLITNDTLNKKRPKNCNPNIGFVFIKNEKFNLVERDLKYLARNSDSILGGNVIYNFSRIKYSERALNE